MPDVDADDQYKVYLAGVVGATIVSVDEEECSVFMHLNDGRVIEFYAEPDGGFSAEIHQPELLH